MSEAGNVAGILQDLSILYELSLSVGRSIELDENCGGFLRTLMARKSLDFASVWIHDRFISGEQGNAHDGLTQVYATPAFRAPVQSLSSDHPLVARVEASSASSLSHGEPGFAAIVTETGIDRGTYALYRLGKIGLLKLYSIARRVPFSAIELSKLRSVVAKFTVSLEGCLDHARVRAAEERRRELELSMLHAQKLESLGLLAGSVAHDFNNLLAVILGNAELARAAVAGHPAQQNVDHILAASARAADLCSQLLAYSGRGPLVNGAVDVNAAVEEMLELIAVTVSKKARVQRRLTASLPSIQGDPTQIRQVVMNLVTNASEALGDEVGDVLVTTGTAGVSDAELAEFHQGDRREAGEYVHLDVLDTGCGMDAATLEKVFDPFFTTKFTGRGLGLAAVLGIVRGHRGAIRVRSELGQGTQVRVLFPPTCSEVRAEVADADSDLPAGPRGEGLVLVVDDERLVRAMLVQLLHNLGFEVILAAEGCEALEVYAARANEIDLVLLDRTMPAMGGDEVFERMVTIHPHVRVVLMSGYSDIDSLPRVADRTPDAFLKKPFRAADLQRAIRSALGERVAHAP